MEVLKLTISLPVHKTPLSGPDSVSPTAVTYRTLEVLSLCLNVNEPKKCRTADRVYEKKLRPSYAVIGPPGIPKGSSSTRQTRAIVYLTTLAPRRRTIDYIQIEPFMI